MKRFFFLLILLCAALASARAAWAVCGTPGKDGVGPASGGVVNSYVASAQSANAGDKTLTLDFTSRVGAANSITPGDLLMLWQTQGASIDSTNTAAYGSGSAANDAAGYTALNGAGHYEFVRVTSAPNASSTIGIAGDGAGGGLKFSYSYDPNGTPRQTFQVIRVPQYSTLSLNAPLTAVKFDGTTGGAVVVDVAGTLTFNTTTGASAYQSGFRGGYAPINDGVNSNSNSVYSVSTTPRNGAGKGEGIAGRPRYVWNETAEKDYGSEGYPGGDGGRGAPGNAGGGGNAHNAGGGGGSNGGGGGRGGYPWEGQPKQVGTQLDTLTNPNGTTRQVAHAFGQGALPLRNGGAAFTDRLFMGGGGGGGDANNATTGVKGGVGGGVVILRAGSFAGSTTIDVRGDSGDRGVFNNAPDGAGGGGAGGTAVLIAKTGGGNFTVQGQGGAGGNTANDPDNPATTSSSTTAHGPGGGGGGGTVLYSPNLSVSTVLTGGAPGQSNDGGAGTITHGATAGTSGLSATLSAADGNNLTDYGDACGINLSATKATTTPAVSSGAAATYVVTLANTGAGAASGAVIDDALPVPFSYDPASPATIVYGAGSSGPPTLAGTNTTANGVITTRFGTAGGDGSNSFLIGPGSNIKITFPVKVNGALGKYQNSTSVSFAGPKRIANANLVTPGGTYADGTTVLGSNYNGALAANTAEDVTVLAPLSGVVYEDTNFAGRNSTSSGGGRPYDATKGMKGVNGARVELYNSDGTFRAFTTTANAGGQDGVYNFTGAPDGVYFVRVVNASVASTRGAATGLVPVQTFQIADETADTTNNATAFPNRVGGRYPAQSDAGANTTNATLNGASFALSSGGIAQSVSRVEVRGGSGPQFGSAGATPSGAAFGFNFDTVVNTNDAGQGSLRQFLLNSNALPNTGLAQDGLTAGVETSIFSIPSNADPLGRPTDPRFASGVAKITLASQLTISDANTSLDGTTQTRNIGDTNGGTFGTGGTVGVQNVPLPTLARPEIEIYGERTIAIGLDIAAASARVTGVAMWGFGSGGDNSTRGVIHVGVDTNSSFAGPTITGVLLGTSAIPDAGGNLVVPIKSTTVNTYGSADLVRANGVDGGTISNSILGFSGGKGIALNSGADTWLVTGNEVRDNARDSITWDNIDAQTFGNRIIANLFYNSGGTGIDSYNSSGGATVTNNTSRNNGINCTVTTGEPAGIRSYGTGNTITFNLVYDNFGAGVLVQSTATSLISRNSIYGNGQKPSVKSATPSYQIGIDLLKSGDAVDHGTAPFVTPNDPGDPDVGGNGLLNFPIITGYSVINNQITLSGFAPPGATVEVFEADPDASGFGQGKTFLFSFVEGSTADTDPTTGAYNSASLQAAGYPQAVADKVGSETAANRFRVVVPAGAATPSTKLATTATVNNLTSEFSLYTGVITPATTTLTLSGAVYRDANRNATLDNNETAIGLSGLFVKLVPQGATSASAVSAVDAASGDYSIPLPANGNYTLVLSNNNNLSDVAPVVPPGYVASEAPNGSRSLVVASQNSRSALNFGLYQDTDISGVVFSDNGASGGIAGNGIRDGAEAGIGGVRLELRDANGTVLARALTDGTGAYAFAVPGTVSGQVSVVETNPAGLLSTGAQLGTTAGAAGGTYNRSTDAISFALTPGQGYTGLNFGDVGQASLTNNGAALGTRGSSVFYPHVFTAQSAGTVTFALSGTATPTNGEWSGLLYNDANNNGQIDAGETQVTGPTNVTAGQQINLIVQHFVPLTASDGSVYTTNLGANFAYSNASPALVQTLSRSDVTTVGVQSNLKLVKSVDRAQAKSGDQIAYTIAYSNNSTDALKNLVIFDSTPAFTTFVSASNGALPTGLTSVVVASPDAGGTGSIRWTFAGSLPANASGTVTFVVRVQ